MADVSLQPILALLGCPVAGNPTQFMMERAFAYHGLDWRYISVEVHPEDLADAVRGMRAMGFAGGNCAEPHKEAIGQYLFRLGTTAEMTGVVNLLIRQQDQLVGENTEGRAVLEAIRRRIDPAGRRCVLLGDGKLARAVAVELALAGVDQVLILSRNPASGRRLANLLLERLEVSAQHILWEDPYSLPPQTELLVHATTIGQRNPEAQVPLDFSSLKPQTLVVDCQFLPPQTHLLQSASQQGCQTIDGLELLLTRSAIDFQLWTGLEPNQEVLREAAEEFLEL
ncbi:MAG: shikimate dehydrogenase [Thermoguttaceae bacterium]|nr:shikimate dehydrogenase [Thermoguttaceae bacterium]MDW8038698.1 shikimate dehydrogenase [Thermoguttaceae bacterium]